jgi:hypothetical protein
MYSTWASQTKRKVGKKDSQTFYKNYVKFNLQTYKNHCSAIQVWLFIQINNLQMQ